MSQIFEDDSSEISFQTKFSFKYTLRQTELKENGEGRETSTFSHVAQYVRNTSTYGVSERGTQPGLEFGHQKLKFVFFCGVSSCFSDVWRRI